MDEELKQEYNDEIEDQFGYRPSDLIWLLATHIAVQHIRMSIAKKLGKDTEGMERSIQHRMKMINTNVELDFRSERDKKYGTGN